MDLKTYFGQPDPIFKNWCIEHYGPRADVVFSVIDSQDSTKLTSFTLFYNGVLTEYTVTSDNKIQLNSVPTLLPFTILITNLEGYVDGVANTYTYATLNGSNIGMTKKSAKSDTIEFKLDWNISVVVDLDSHVVIQDLAGNEIGHVYYGNTIHEDEKTNVTLDVDNVTRQGDKPPEITTISSICPEYKYYYYVHDYSETGKITKTNLNLNIVLSNETLNPPITIPTSDSPYNCWNVCKIVNGQLIRASDVLTETVTEQPNCSY